MPSDLQTHEPVTARAAWQALLLVTLLGAWLRFYHLADFYADVDHAFPIAEAIRRLQLGQWPLLGQGTSVFVSNPPRMTYILAVPWALFGSEWGAVYFAMALNLLAVPLTYRDYHLDLNMYDGLHRLSLILQPPGGAAPIDYYRGELVNP